MTTFWALASILLVLALLFVLPPLWWRRDRQQLERTALNTEVIKDQLEELNADLSAGKLNQADYSAARQDLERELLDNASAEKQVDGSGKGGRWVGIVLALLIPATAVLLYQQIGTEAIIDRLAMAPAAQQSAGSAGTTPSMETVIAKLAQRMEEQPDNLEGWLLLGRSYASMKRFPEAVDAYQRAMQLGGDNAEVLSDYADLLVVISGGRFTDQAAELLNKAVASDPRHLKARWLRGHWHFQQTDYSAAIADWQQVAAALPPGNENLAVIEQQIQTARNRIGQAGGTVPQLAAETIAPEQTSGGIQVKVTLDETLADKADPGDTLFIFARPTSGARMPLAIVRKRVSDLPVSVTLTDSMAMTPAMVLSKFDQVTVGARVSKSGQAMPASGDLQGLVTPVSTTSGDAVELTIDQVVP